VKFDGITRKKGRADRIKWLCPKFEKVRINKKSTYILSCSSPYTNSLCGHVYQIPIYNDYRMNTAVSRNSELYNTLYKIRSIMELTNFMIKYPMALNYTQLNNTISLKSALVISTITHKLFY